MRKPSAIVAVIALTIMALTFGGLAMAQHEGHGRGGTRKQSRKTNQNRRGVKEQGGRPLRVTLTGAAEVPQPGDPDGTGTATFRLNPGQGQVCYELKVSGIAPATAAHIHSAAVGSAGPVVVGLEAPSDGDSSGCANLDREKIQDIIQNPSNYYVNVHNAEFPGGALRAQLSK